MQIPTLSLKVMSFNIRYGTADDGENSWPLRNDAVIEFLGTSGYDIIGLQEVLFEQLQEIHRALPHFHWVGVGRDDGETQGEYSAILFDSRRLTVNSSDTFWFSKTPAVVASTSWGNELTRVCTHGTFEVGGHAFDFYNLHIDHESAISRLKSIELLLQRIHAKGSSNPVIVTGDFNEGEDGPAVELMERAGFDETYRAMNPEGPEQATYHGWKGTIHGEKIDFIFVKGVREVLDAAIVRENPFRKYLSDHYPVVATLLV